MLMTVPSTISVIGVLICGNGQSWQTWIETLWTGIGKSFKDSTCFMFYSSNNCGAMYVEIDGFAFNGKSILKILGLPFSSKFDLGLHIVCTAKSTSKEIRALICSMNLCSSEVVLYLYKSAIMPCMEYCCHIWPGALFATTLRCYKNIFVNSLFLRIGRLWYFFCCR